MTRLFIGFFVKGQKKMYETNGIYWTMSSMLSNWYGVNRGWKQPSAFLIGRKQKKEIEKVVKSSMKLMGLVELPDSFLNYPPEFGYYSGIIIIVVDADDYLEII